MKVRDLIKVNFLTIVILSKVAMFYGINGNITSYNCQQGLNLRHALWQWLEPLSC